MHSPKDITATGMSKNGEDAKVRATERHFGGVALLTISGTDTTLRLRPSAPASRIIEFFLIHSGSVEFLNNTEWGCSPIQFLVAPDGLDGYMRLSGQWRVSSVRIPRERMDRYISPIPATVFRLECTLLGRSFLGFVESLSRSKEQPSPVEARAVEHVVETMAGAILVDRVAVQGPAQDQPNAQLRGAAFAVIIDCSDDVDLTPARVAQQVGCSLRRVQNAFADADTSVAREIRRCRARKARALLINNRHDAMSIDEIAERSGFGTSVSMRRALIDIFGAGPRQIRQQRRDD